VTATRGLRIAVAGATGAVGSEVLAALDASSIPVGQLVAVAGEESLGTDIEFQGELSPVHAELPALHGLDAVICCTPRGPASEIARAALRAEVPCLDLSGVFADRAEVPMAWAGEPQDPAAPLVSAPPPTALVWGPLLRALAELAPIERVDGTVLEAASASGRRGIEALSAESMALFNQQEAPEDGVLGHPLAFDCHPRSGSPSEGGRLRERELRGALARWLEPAPALAARWVAVPAFVGEASSLGVRFAAPVDAARAAECLAKAAGVELWEREGEGPNLRASAGSDTVIAARPEADPDDAARLRLWAVGDVLRLAAANVVAVLAARPPRA